MSKIFANTNAAKYGDIMSEDAGFVVTDAHASKSGKLLFMNKNLKRWLRRENDDLKFFNINFIMP